MTNTWFRLYAEFASDPKVQILTEALQRRYVMALCLQCNGALQDRPKDEIALALRITVQEWEETVAEFTRRGLFTENGQVNGWNKRQYVSDLVDPTAATRQKRYREKQRDERNSTVTSRLPEADTEQIQIQIQNRTEEASRLPQAAPLPTTAEKVDVYFGESNESLISERALVLLGTNFDPNDEWAEYAAKMGFVNGMGMRELEKFNAYWLTGKGAGKRKSKRGWRQAWSNWLDIAARRQ